MATLRDIRNRITGVRSIEKITSAMKMVSSVKVRRAQKQAESARPFYHKIEKMLISLVKSGEVYDNPLFNAPNEEVKKAIFFVIAGDKGLCGSFNSALFKYVIHCLDKEFPEKFPNAEVQLVLFGNKAISYFKKKPYKILHTFPNVFQPLDYSIVLESNESVVKRFLNSEIDIVKVFYSRFVNMMKQEPTRFQLLPFNLSHNLSQSSLKQEETPTGSPEYDDTIVHSSLSDIHNGEDTEKDIETTSFLPDYIFEPDKNSIIDNLINQYINLNIWGPLLESNAAEQAARLFAMDKATQNANDLIKELELQFNNARQEAITTEMLEIVGGAESLKNY